jgi:hypothetical protein
MDLINQAKNIDIHVVEGDLQLDSLLNPLQLNNADVIAQDVKHRVLESGLLARLVKQRNKNSISMILTEIELLVEQDDRLIPGSIQVHHNIDKTISVFANTKEYGSLSLSTGQGN